MSQKHETRVSQEDIIFGLWGKRVVVQGTGDPLVSIERVCVQG